MDSLIVATVTLALTGATLAQAPGPGGGRGQGWQFGAGNTPGWALMSEVERVEHRNRMMSFQSYGECRTYLEGHHQAMEARAKEQGKTLRAAPRSNLCDRMRQAGRLK